MRVSLKARSVIDKWEESANTAEAEAIANKDDDTERIMWSAKHILPLMRERLIDGTARYVFALVTGEGAEDIQALAVVLGTDAWDDFIGEGIEIVEARLLMTKPTVDRRRDAGGELLLKINEWARATGRLSTISAEDIPDWSEGSAYELNHMVWPFIFDGHALGGASNGQAYHMIELEV